MSEIKKIATRESYGNALVELGKKYDDFVVLDADLSAATKTDIFKKAFPKRHINCGIAECNMMGIAAGIATTGKVPFVSSFAMFAAGRAFEQIRNSIGYPHLNVKIGATHAGISVGEDGATHQCLEDIGLMRTIPGMVILNPADATEARLAVKAAIEHDGPVYLRFGRLPVETIFDDSYDFKIGKGVMISDGSDVTLIGTGLLVPACIEAKNILAESGISARVVNMASIKPIDEEIIIKAAHETGAIVTAEEHNIIGGLGSAVAEVLVENAPVPMQRVGTRDVFGRSGKPAPLLKMYGLDAETIAEKAKIAIAKKNA
ncbi:MAG: transketolase family protein [Oscillospiraceae bacterium]